MFETCVEQINLFRKLAESRFTSELRLSIAMSIGNAGGITGLAAAAKDFKEMIFPPLLYLAGASYLAGLVCAGIILFLAGLKVSAFRRRIADAILLKTDALKLHEEYLQEGTAPTTLVFFGITGCLFLIATFLLVFPLLVYHIAR